MRANEAPFRAMLESLRDIPIVGDVRGAGYFQAIELVKDRDTKETFDDEESETLLRGFLSGELFRRGLICRADDRGDPVIQLSPPLIAGPEQFEEIEAVLRPVLEEASAPHARRRDAPGGEAPGADADRRRAAARPRRCACWRARRARRARCAGSTSPSSRTRRRGCPAASCC